MKKILTITILLLGALSLFNSCKKDDSSKPLYQNKWILSESESDEEPELQYYFELRKNGKGTYAIVANESLVNVFKAYAERTDVELTDAQKKSISKLKVNDLVGVEITYTFTYENDGKNGSLTLSIPSVVDDEGNPDSETFKCSTESKDLMLIYDPNGSAHTLRSVSSLKMSLGTYYPELGAVIFG